MTGSREEDRKTKQEAEGLPDNEEEDYRGRGTCGRETPFESVRVTPVVRFYSSEFRGGGRSENGVRRESG